MWKRNLYIVGVTIVILAGVKMISTQRHNSAEASDGFAKMDETWSLIWSDEFNGDGLDPKKWAPETSCWGGGNHERQCYTAQAENISVSEGILKLTARAESFTGEKYPQDRADRGGQITQAYTSGKIRTKQLAQWRYGRFEARIKLPQGQSTWPAFWMLPAENHYGKWPLSGEIDIMEAVNLGAICEDCENSDTENRSSAALHFGHAWPNNQFHTQKHILPNGPEAYHVYAVEWSENQIDWFVDDHKIFTVMQDDWFSDGVDKTENKLAPFDQPFYLMLNLAVGGALPDGRNEKRFNPNSFPNTLYVDWVRVYQCKADMQTGNACVASGA